MSVYGEADVSSGAGVMPINGEAEIGSRLLPALRRSTPAVTGSPESLRSGGICAATTLHPARKPQKKKIALNPRKRHNPQREMHATTQTV